MTFDPSAPENQPNYFTPGEYKVAVDDAEYKANQAGTGSYIQVQCRIVSGGEGTQDGKPFRLWLNVDHDKPNVATNGRIELAQLCRAAGLTAVLEDHRHAAAKAIVGALFKADLDQKGDFIRVAQYIMPKAQPYNPSNTPEPQQHRTVDAPHPASDDGMIDGIPF